LVGSLLLGLGITAWAQTPTPTPLPANVTIFASGLKNPRGLKFGPDGNLYVAEAGDGGNISTNGDCDQVLPPVGPYMGGFRSRISRFTPNGTRVTVANNLPSTMDSSGDFIGIADVAFLGDTLYALEAGAGCSHGLANTPNSVLRIANGGYTQVADLSAFIKAHPVAHPNPPDFEPDGVWYSMIAVGDDLFAVEPNHGELDMITTAGAVTRVADISATQGHAVPTAVVYDGNFYVAEFGLFPVTDGSQDILKITPAGKVSVFATGLTNILGLAFDAGHRLYVLESSTKNKSFPTPGTGEIVRIGPSGQLEKIVGGLNLPGAMTFGSDGALYVSNWSYGPPDMGQILKVTSNPTVATLGNISTRGLVQTGDDVVIGGFILDAGSVSTNVIIRGIGPSLSSSGITGALSDPTIDLRDASGNRIAFDNDWQDNAASAAKITAAGLAPTDPKEAAIYSTLAPGPYTAILAGRNGATGIGLVEVYQLQ